MIKVFIPALINSLLFFLIDILFLSKKISTSLLVTIIIFCTSFISYFIYKVLLAKIFKQKERSSDRSLSTRK